MPQDRSAPGLGLGSAGMEWAKQINCRSQHFASSFFSSSRFFFSAKRVAVDGLGGGRLVFPFWTSSVLLDRQTTITRRGEKLLNAHARAVIVDDG